MKTERDLIQQLKGRAKFCRDRGEVKTPELLERAVKALEQREGYKLVPLEPTDEMINRGRIAKLETKGSLRQEYKAMIGAAP